MAWVIGIGIFFVVVAIVSSLSSSKKQQEAATHVQTQMLNNVGRSTQVVSSDGTISSWSLTPQSVSVWEQSFALAAEGGPSYLVSFKQGMHGGRLHLNGTEVAKGSPFKMNESYNLTLKANGQPVACRLDMKSTLTSYTLSAYIEGQYIGQVLGKA